MPVTPTYPGVYIQEVPSGVRTITPVATAVAAFVGRASRGPTNQPTTITSFADFTRKFGGLAVDSTMSYAVSHYYLHGGGQAIIVRVAAADAVKANVDLSGLQLEARGEGKWGADLRVRVDYDTKDKDSGNPKLFNLSVFDPSSQALEEFRNLSVETDAARYVETVLEDESALIRLVPGSAIPSARPGNQSDPASGEWFLDRNSGSHVKLQGGVDGGPLQEADMIGNPSFTTPTGIYALDRAELFTILCLPPPSKTSEVSADSYAAALQYVVKKRAMLLIDPPASWKSVDAAQTGVDQIRGKLGGEELTRNAALFFPRLKMSDPLRENRQTEFVPCGAVAGICARTDVSRGVWKSPAGISAGFLGVSEFTVKMNDDENGLLNPLGVNCLRTFPVHGRVIWGSRTLAGADRQGSEWKYLAVRRFTLFLEESLYRGTQWVVFEPNDEPLWAQIRVNIDTFLFDLFRQGAFQGTTRQQAYFVKCDGETTQQSDIDRGIVNIEIGFAPLKPAEFVILKIQQIAGKRGN
jgi:phage tail sheath protein FI